MPTERVIIKVDAEGAVTADKEIKGIGSSASESNKSVTAMKRVLGTLVTAATIRKLIQYADAWTTITNRIKLVTNSAKELKAVQMELLAVSNRTRTDLKTTAELYQRIAMNSRELGLSHRELIDVTETIGQTLAISGASAESANAALIQLSQGLAANALRGQELNSVMEQTPRLAQAIAEGMGITVGELRKVAAEGAISAGVVIEALKSQAGIIEDEFGKISPTVSQAMTVANNQMTAFVGNLNDAAGGTEWLADAIIDLANALNADLAIASINGHFEMWRVTINQVTGETAGFGEEWRLVGDIMSRAIAFTSKAFAEFPVNVKAAIQIAVVEVMSFAQRFPLWIGQGVNGAIVAFNRFVQEALLSFMMGMKEMQMRFHEWVSDTFGKDNSDKIKQLQNELSALDDTMKSVGDSGGIGASAYKKELSRIEDQLKSLSDVRTNSIQSIMAEREVALESAAAQKKAVLELREAQREADLTKKLGTPSVAGPTEEEIKKAQKAALEIAKEAAERSADLVADFQSTLSDSLKAGFKGDTDSIRQMWSDLLLDMATEALAADIMNSLFPNREGASTSGSGAILGGIGDIISSGGASTTTEGQVAMAGGLPFPGQGADASGMPSDPLADMANNSATHTETIKQNMGGLFGWLKEGFTSLKEFAGGFIDKFVGGTSEAGGNLKTDVAGGIKGVQQASQAMNQAQQTQNATAAAQSQAQAGSTASAWAPAAQMTSVASFGGSVMTAIAQMLIMSTVMKSISKFADGGIVNSPQLFSDSGNLAVRGEAGPEAIVPLPDGRSIPVKMKGEKTEGGTTNGGNQMNNTNVNLIDPEMVPALMDTPQGESAVLNIISNNPDAVAQAVNGG